MNKKKLATLLVLFILVFVFAVSFLSVSGYPAKIILGQKTFEVEVVDTAYLLQKGLSGRKGLESNEGMLFVFENSDKHSFWMKDMLFSIDIIWLDSNFKIVHIEKSVSPESYPKSFVPNSPAKYVLEVRAGEANALGLKVGDTAEFLKKDFKISI